MGKKCCVTGCRSGYAKTSTETKEGQSDGSAADGQGCLPVAAAHQGAKAGSSEGGRAEGGRAEGGRAATTAKSGLPETAAAAEGTICVTEAEKSELSPAGTPGIYSLFLEFPSIFKE